MKRLGIWFFIFAILIADCASAQEQDVFNWVQISVEFEPVDDIEVQFSQMLRTELYPEQLLRQWNTEFGAAYAFNKHWKAGAEVRLTFAEGELLPRYAIYGRYRDGMGDFELQFRTKLQTDVTRTSLPETTLRNRFRLGYEVNKDMLIYVSYESFYRMYYIENLFSENRIETGIDYSINKHNSINLAYINSSEINESNPKTRHIASISYNYKF
jgi:hypothetical protein